MSGPLRGPGVNWRAMYWAIIRLSFQRQLTYRTANLAGLATNALFGLPHDTSFLSPVAGFGMLAAAFAFWRVGVAHYQSTGT
jgi:hypothetical protein